MSPAPRLSLARASQTWGLVGTMAVVALASAATYYVTTPEALPRTEAVVTASVPSNQSVYLGVLRLPADFDRELEVHGVQVEVTATSEVAVLPLLCVGGDIDVTTSPTTRCDDVVDPVGERLGAGDTLVLQITGDGAAVAVVDPVTISFREGVRRGSRVAGSGARVRVLGAAAA